MATHRLFHSQSARESLYCVNDTMHVRVVDPLSRYSGHAHTVELSPCDCPAPGEAQDKPDSEDGGEQNPDPDALSVDSEGGEA